MFGIECMTQGVPFEDVQKDASFTSSEIIELIHYRLCMPGTRLQLIQSVVEIHRKGASIIKSICKNLDKDSYIPVTTGLLDVSVGS